MTRAAISASILLVLCLLLPSNAAAKMDSLHVMDARVDGAGSFDAGLAGAWLENAPLREPGHLNLTVMQGDLDLNEESVDVYAAQIGVTPSQHSRHTSSLAGSRANAFELGANVRLIVAAEPGRAHADGNAMGMDFGPPGVGNTTFPARGSRDGGWAISTTTAMQMKGASDETVAITGAFQFVAWNASFTLHNATGTYVVQTGSVNEPTPGSPPGTPVSRHVQREAVFRVANGTLTLPREDAFNLFASAADVNLDAGHLQVLNPLGLNPVDGSEIAAGSHRLNLSAPLSVTMFGGAGGLQLGFSKAPPSADLDGRLILPPGASANWFAIGLIALVVIPAAGLAWSQVRHRWRLRTLDHLMVAQNSVRASLLAHEIRRRRPREPHALVAEAISLVHRNDFQSARQVLENEAWTSALQPIRDYLRACVEAGQGHRDAAVRCLKACLKAAPEMVEDAAMNPRLRDILQEARKGMGT